MIEEYTAFIDGASSGNPGSAGVGIVVYRGEEEVLRESKHIGHATNNVAEYTALLVLLRHAEKFKMKKLKVSTDSELLVKQIKGEYKIKNDVLRGLLVQIKELSSKIDFEIGHIGRDYNAVADKLAKTASKRKGGDE